MQSEGIEDCHWFGPKTESKKTIVLLTGNIVKRTLLNEKKCSSIDNNKFKFNAEAKLCINKYLNPMNKSIAFNSRKLKRSNIHACYTREGVVHIKQEESSKPFNIFHMSKLHLFPDFIFVDHEKGDINTSVVSSHWFITKLIIKNTWLTLVWVTQGYSSSFSGGCGVP